MDKGKVNGILDRIQDLNKPFFDKNLLDDELLAIYIKIKASKRKKKIIKLYGL